MDNTLLQLLVLVFDSPIVQECLDDWKTEILELRSVFDLPN